MYDNVRLSPNRRTCSTHIRTAAGSDVFDLDSRHGRWSAKMNGDPWIGVVILRKETTAVENVGIGVAVHN